MNHAFELFTNCQHPVTSRVDMLGQQLAGPVLVTVSLTGTATPNGKVKIDISEYPGAGWIERPELTLTDSAPVASIDPENPIPSLNAIRARLEITPSDDAQEPNVTVTGTITA